MHRPLVEEVSTADAPKKGYGVHEKPVIQRQMTGEEKQETHELETVWKAYQKFEDKISSKTVSFQINNMAPVAYLLNKDDTHCKTLIILVRIILLKCHRKQVVIFPEFFSGLAKLWANAPSRCIKVQEWNLRDPTCYRLCKLCNWSSRCICMQACTQGT